MKVILKKRKVSAKFGIVFPKGETYTYSEGMQSIEHNKTKNIWIRVEPNEFEIEWTKIDSDIEVNVESVPNCKITYDIYWNGGLGFKALLHDPNNDRRAVSFEDAPKVIEFTMDKPLKDFTIDEQRDILEYRGLTLSDGFEAMDVFMQGNYISENELV